MWKKPDTNFYILYDSTFKEFGKRQNLFLLLEMKAAFNYGYYNSLEAGSNKLSGVIQMLYILDKFMFTWLL
jgi:hypothetical protein